MRKQIIKRIVVINPSKTSQLKSELKEVVEYRQKYPESSLQELSEIMSNELGYSISKSGLNHRFRKIKEIIKRIEDNQEEKNVD